MLLKSGPCFTAELELNCPTIVACVAALPVGAPAVAGDLVLGPDNQYHALPSTVAPNGSETKVVAGANVTVTGSGTTAAPYVVAAVAGAVADGSETKVIAGPNIVVTGSGTAAAPYVVTTVPKLHASNTTGECPTLSFNPGLSNVGDVIHTSAVLTVTNPSSVYPASGTFTTEANGFIAVVYPGSFYVIKTQISKNGGAFADLSSMSFSNQGGSAPENYGGSAISTKTDSISIPAGGTATIQTRVVLSFKGALTVSDVITGVCIAQNISVTNHD
jgi:hypothetical protein